ncbi:MAG: zinc dependent phospholipase C family protein [Thermicanus sp.]|nr:zinc dependent phospholipase C family protein [Thermicanus sp.]
MPNIWTHIHFGETLLRKTGKIPYPEEVKPYFRLGTQGPDPFFYHNFWPWKTKTVAEIGNKIHHEQCGPFLLEMIRYGKQYKGDEKLKAYILGFITHHLLDRNTHPYIIYRSGNEGKRHSKLEIIIDTLLMKEFRGMDTWKTPVYKEIYIGQELYPPITEMLSKLITYFFPETARQMPRGYVSDSYRHMICAWKILYDPTGIKHLLLREWVSPFSHHKNVGEKDYLNRSRTPWLHPANDHERSSATFFDLLSQAEQEGLIILPLILEYWEDEREGYPEPLIEAIGNRSYDTGKDCTLPLQNRHFDPIL